MTRKIRLGFTFVLSIALAVIAFSYPFGSPLWTSLSPTQTQHETITPPHFLNQVSSQHENPAMPHTKLATLPVSHNAHLSAHGLTQPLTVHSVTNVAPPSSKPIRQSAVSTISYRVHSGDTLWRISTIYGITVHDIKVQNHLATNVIQSGQTLQIQANRAFYRATSASKAMIAAAPDSLLPIYQAAGKKYGVPWTVLAAIHKEETDFDTSGNAVSCAGAVGPMQFMPTTFSIYGVPAPGHKYANIHNVQDAIYSTAHMLAAKGMSSNPYHAIYEYNHSSRYVQDILHMASI